MSPQQVAAEPLAGNVWVGTRGRGPAQGPVPWAAALHAWGGAAAARLRDLRPAADGSLPAALPAAWSSGLAAGPAQPTEWAASADSGWVRHAPAAGGTPRFFTIAEDGRLLDPPRSAVPPASAAAGWVDACIIDSPAAKGRAPGAVAPLPPLRAAAAAAAPRPAPPARRRPPFFFPRSLYTLGKAYACKARSECDSVWASPPQDSRLLHPQRRPWKALARANFGRAFPGLGAAVMLTAIKPAAFFFSSESLHSRQGLCV
jgi:hypothetical protein